MENSNGKSTGLKIALGILLVLLFATGFYTSKLHKEKKENEATLTLQKTQVMSDLNAMAKQYDVAIGENDITNERLAEARGRIQGLMDSLKVSQNSVSNLWKYRKKFLALEEEMSILMTENDLLKVENSLLASSLDSTNVQLAERAVFTDSLLSQNTQLANIVENAAILQTTVVKGSGVIERSSGKLIPTERARRSDKIRVCFTVAKNTLVVSGDKELYVQILDPLNNVLGSNEQIQFDEDVLNYSLISKFNYENRNLNICEFVGPNGDFEKGRYVINVFNKNERVSTSEFVLK